MPTFSIIVPIYKVEKYLDQCIQSIIKQSCTDFELILVDDGSPDGCGKICDQYARQDDRIRVIHKQNEGLVRARNSGLEIAVGEYIVNVDGDDYILPGMLECLKKHIQETHADVYCFGCLEQRGEGYIEKLPNFDGGLYADAAKKQKLFERLVYDDTKKFFTYGMYPSVWLRVVKRELFTRYRLKVDFSLAIGEDFATTLPIMLAAESIELIPKPFYFYRIIESSASHQFNAREMQFVATMLKGFVKEIDLERYDMRQQLGAYTVDVLYNHLCDYARHADCYETYREYIGGLDEILFEFVGYCRYSIKSLHAAVIIPMIKHQWWRLLWLYARRK